MGRDALTPMSSVPLFPWDLSARQDTIERTKEVIAAIGQTLADSDSDLKHYREGLAREKAAAEVYLEALETAEPNS